MLTGVMLVADRCAGQTLWQVTPYEFRIVLALDDVPELAPGVGSRLQDDLSARCDASFAAACNSEVRLARSLFRAAAVQVLDELTGDDLIEHDPDWGQLDKLMVAVVRATAAGFEVRVREMDCRTQIWGPVHARSIRQPAWPDRRAPS